MPGTGPNIWVDWNGTRYLTSNFTIANDAVWDSWHGGTGSTLLSNHYAANQTTYNLAWQSWNQNYTATTNTITVYSDAAWNRWIQVGDGTPVVATPVYDMAPRTFGTPLVRSEEEWTAIREEQERQRAARDLLQKEARAEARKLMAVVLSKEQLKQYEKLGYFEVVGSAGGLFRIYHGTSGNLKQVVDGHEVNALCVHPRLRDHRSDEGESTGYLPTEDSMVAQAFALMHDELGTVQLANVHRGPRHLRAVPEAA